MAPPGHPLRGKPAGTVTQPLPKPARCKEILAAIARKYAMIHAGSLAFCLLHSNHDDIKGAKMTICRDCGAPLESTDGMWVDARSGDDGGTYDICPAREDGPYGHRTLLLNASLERLHARSAVLTEGFPDVKVRGDQYGWYVRVAVKPPRPPGWGVQRGLVRGAASGVAQGGGAVSRYRWAACAADVSRERHLVIPGAVTTASDPKVRRGNLTKPPCKTCAERED